MSKNFGIILATLFLYCIASCYGGTYYVSPTRTNGVGATGSIDYPFDNILYALNYIKNAGSSVLYLLYGSGAPHYLMLYEEHPSNYPYYDLRSYPSFGSGTRNDNILIELNTITIKPLYCNEAPAGYNTSAYYCTSSTTQRLQIFTKTSQFSFWIRGSVYFQNIILNGIDDFILWNSQTSDRNYCQYNRLTCCGEKQQTYTGPYGSVIQCVSPSKDYSGYSVNPRMGLFVLDTPSSGYSQISLIFDNCDMKNFVSPQLTSLMQISTTPVSIQIRGGVSYNMFFDKGFFYQAADSSVNNGSSIIIQDFNFTGYNYWTLRKTSGSRKEGYLFHTANLYSGSIQILRSTFQNLTTSVRDKCWPLTTSYFTAPYNNKLLSQARSRSNIWNQFHQDHLSKPYMSSVINIQSFSGALTIKDTTFQNVIGTSGSVIHVDDTPNPGTWFMIYNSYFDNNYAYDGFANIVIARSSNGAFSRMLACPRIEIVNSQFTNALGCPGSYGNVASICYWDTTPTTSALSSYAIGTTAVADYNMTTTYTLLPDFWNEQDERYSYVRVKNSIFENNMLALSNSLAIVGGYFSLLDNNTFQNNGGMNQDYLPDRFNGSYFATRHPDQVPTDYTLHFGQTSAVLMDHIVKYTSKKNTFTNNWCSWEGSLVLGYSLTVKSWIKVENSIKFDGDTYTQHYGVPFNATAANTTDLLNVTESANATNTTTGANGTNGTNTTQAVNQTRIYLAPILSFGYDSRGSNTLMQDSRWTIGSGANIKMNGVTLTDNIANYDYSNYTGGEGELAAFLEIIIASKRRYSTGFIKFAFNYEVEDIVVNVLNIDNAIPAGGKAGFSFTNGEISKNTLSNEACMFPTAWAESFNLDTVKIYENTIFPTAKALDESSSVNLPLLTKVVQIRSGMFCLNALETLLAVTSVRLSVNRASISNNTGVLFIVYPLNSGYLSISNSLIINNVCKQSSIITIQEAGDLNSINNIFISNTSPLGTTFATALSRATSIFGTYLNNTGVHASILYLNGGGSSCSYEIGAKVYWNDINPANKIFTSTLAPQGGLYFQSSSCTDFGLVDFKENPAYSGIVTNFESKTSIFNSKITNHLINGTSVVGNFVYLSKLKMKDVNIVNAAINRVSEIPIKQAGIAVLYTSDIEFENVDFNQVALGNSTNLIYGNSIAGNLTNIGLTNCLSVTDGAGSLMDFISSTLVIDDIACSQVTNLFSLMSSQVSFKTVSINNLQPRNGKQSIITMADTRLTIKGLKYTSITGIDGSLLPLVKGDNDYIQIEDAQFLQIPDSQTKLFDLKNSKQLFVTNSVFDYQEGSGVATVFDIATPDFTSIIGSSFKVSGRAMRLTEAQGAVNFIGNIILSDTSTIERVYLENNKEMYLFDNTFSNIQAVRDSTLLQAPLQITNCAGLTQFSGNTFTSLNGYNGVVEVQSTDTPYNVTAKRNTFINNMGTYGGAIYLVANKIWSGNTIPTFLLEDSVFILNQALNYRGYYGRGGAIHMASPGQTKQSIVMKNNTFVKNTADRLGGAIYYDYSVPSIGSDSVFKENYAQRLNHIASYPVRIVQLDLENPVNITYVPNDEPLTLAHQIETYQWTNIPSGILADQTFIFALLDAYDQIVYDDDLSILELSVPSLPESRWNIFSSLVTLTARDGLFNFTNFKFAHQVSGSISVTFTTKAIDNSTIPAVDNLTFVPTTIVNVAFRSCDLGEFISEEDYNMTVCQKCQPSFWQLTPASAEPSCISCDETTTRCLGGNKVGPKPGYWRLNATANMVLKCPNPSACIGNELSGDDPAPNLSLTGECAEGYTGNVCGNCKAGYGRSSSGTCEKCSQKTFQYIIFFGLKLVSLVLIVKQVKSIKELVEDFKSKNSLKLEIAVLMRVLSNYIQFVSVISTMNISWPSVMGDTLSSGSSVSVPTNEVMSVECFFQLPENKAESQLVFWNVLFTNVMPIALVVISLFVWLAYYLIKKKKIWRNKSLVNNLLMTALVICFNLQPSAVTQTFSLFQCANLYRSDDPAYYLKSDYDIRCWEGNHLLWTLGFSIPSIVIWVLGFPLLMLYLLVKNRKKLNEDKIVQRYLFLYVGYKDDKYYWEFVIVARKILLIFSAVIASLHSVNLQIYFSVCLTIAAFGLQLQYRPYADDRFNTLEAVSLLSSQIINFGGLYFQVINRDSGMDIFLLVASLLGAAYFFFLFLRLFLGMQIRLLLNNPIVRKIGKAICCCINFDNLEAKLSATQAMSLMALKSPSKQNIDVSSPGFAQTKVELAEMEFPDIKEEEHHSPKKFQTKSSLRYTFNKLTTKDLEKVNLDLTDEISPRLSVSARDIITSPFNKVEPLIKQASLGAHEEKKVKKRERYYDKSPAIEEDDADGDKSPSEETILQKQKPNGSTRSRNKDWSSVQM